MYICLSSGDLVAALFVGHVCQCREAFCIGSDNDFNCNVESQMSGDQTTMDLEIQFSMSRVVNAFMQLLGIFALMSTVTWQVLLLLIPIALACILLQVRTYLFLMQ